MSLDATVGGANSNSYLTVAEAQAYWDTRLFTDMWDNSNDQEAALIWATRTLDRLFSGLRKFVECKDDCGDGYYVTCKKWTGAPASTTQRLAWPRAGMYDLNGNAIATNVIPQDLKDAVAEMAGQMSRADRTLENDVSVQGITDVKAGPVAVSFGDYVASTKVLPDSVMLLIPPSWLTDEVIDYINNAFWEVV